MHARIGNSLLSLAAGHPLDDGNVSLHLPLSVDDVNTIDWLRLALLPSSCPRHLSVRRQCPAQQERQLALFLHTSHVRRGYAFAPTRSYHPPPLNASQNSQICVLLGSYCSVSKAGPWQNNDGAAEITILSEAEACDHRRLPFFFLFQTPFSTLTTSCTLLLFFPRVARVR